MATRNKRLTLLSEAEQAALYELPDFDHDQCVDYLTLTEEEQALMQARPHLSAKIHCALQIGYFKAVQFFFPFAWKEVDPDIITFIQQQYFPDQILDPQPITKHEYYKQCREIAALFGYSLWSSQFEPLVRSQTMQIIQRDVNPSFIVMELINFFKEKKIIRPHYTTLQTIIGDTLNAERQRQHNIIHTLLTENDKLLLQKLLQQEESLSGLAALKQEAKDFKARMMAAEREKLMMLKPLYSTAKTVLSALKLSKQTIQYYTDLIQYYTIYDLRKKLKPAQTYLYLLCYIALRYQQLNDNLVDAFCYHLKQFEQESKEKAKEAFYQHQKQHQNEEGIMRRFAHCFIDDNVSNRVSFGDVRKQAFEHILSEEELRKKLSGTAQRPLKEMDFRWESLGQLGKRFKNQLRPLLMALDFSSTVANNPWLAALDWFKTIFQNQKSLSTQVPENCPQGTIPKRLQQYLVETDQEGKTIKLHADRYEFWIYRQLKKRLRAGELYLEDSIHHRCLEQELVCLEEKESILQELKIPALSQPIENRLDDKFAELHELWIAFNDDLKQGRLKHLRYDEDTKTLHLKKYHEHKEEELQHNFYSQLPLCDITDVLQFVHEPCDYLSALTPIQPRRAQPSTDKKSNIAVIIAQALNHGNAKMAEICDIPYHMLQETYQSRIRLATLKKSNEKICNGIAKMPIFPHYSMDLDLLYSSVDGQKYEVERPTIKARNSKKYFKKGKGVAAYTLLANHISLQTELIGTHEHESYYVFDIWYNNTTDVMPDVVTGDMHCINKGNFAIMDWFGGQLFPRFTNLEAQRKHLYCPRLVEEYKDGLVQPVGQIDRQLIENNWPMLQRIIATLASKEMKQSTLIKKLCTFTSGNATRKALFEYDKLIRSIHTLKYMRDPQIQKNTHRSQNRIESYHALRAAISQVGGRKQLAGRTDIAVEISNQCGRLVANAIIYYNSAILSKVLEAYEKAGNKKGLAFLKKISPVAWAHIHFQGHFVFSDEITIDLNALIAKLNWK
ncbi:MAG: Tn3 family transposase [Gammaproteobacteria bacterium]